MLAEVDLLKIQNSDLNCVGIDPGDPTIITESPKERRKMRN